MAPASRTPGRFLSISRHVLYGGVYGALCSVCTAAWLPARLSATLFPCLLHYVLLPFNPDSLSSTPLPQPSPSLFNCFSFISWRAFGESVGVKYIHLKSSLRRDGTLCRWGGRGGSFLRSSYVPFCCHPLHACRCVREDGSTSFSSAERFSQLHNRSKARKQQQQQQQQEYEVKKFATWLLLFSFILLCWQDYRRGELIFYVPQRGFD